jgi:FKBP-type peptidyl-prolyl cis-trans isomerase 2
MNRQQRRALGADLLKLDKKSSNQAGNALENLQAQINELNKRLAQADQDIDKLMTMDMSRKLDGTQSIEKLDTVALGFLGRLYNDDGTLQDLPFEGGVSQYLLISRFNNGEFIPGFEDQLEGMKPGENRQIDVSFPTNYAPHLAGKKANFDVVVIAAWRLDETLSYVDKKIQAIYRAKIEKEKAAREAAQAQAETK